MVPDADAAASARRADPFAPLTTDMLDVGDGHELYVESVGRTEGIPAIYLHGGPGSGTPRFPSCRFPAPGKPGGHRRLHAWQGPGLDPHRVANG